VICIAVALVRGTCGEPIAPPAVDFTIPHVVGRPGGTVEVPLRLEATRGLSMVVASIEYDPSILQLIEPHLSQPLMQLRERVPEGDFEFTWDHDNEAGWLQVQVVVDYEGREDYSIPPGLVRNAFVLEFALDEDAAVGRYPIRFSLPGDARFPGRFERDGEPAYNVAREPGLPTVRPGEGEDDLGDTMIPTVHNGTVLAVIGDVGFFLRGDANLDERVDISDPLRILDVLFSAGEPLLCPEVADHTDDGEVDISDSISLLHSLFLDSADSEPTSDEPLTIPCALPSER